MNFGGSGGSGGKLWNAVASVSSAAGALLAESAAPEDVAKRKQICEVCVAVDETGARLFRLTAGKETCGAMFFGKMLRDPKVSGCGCILAWKWALKNQHCPLEKW
jgi:hypothetical protein